MKRPVRVLIVEDSDDDAFVMGQELRTAGWDVTSERVESDEDLRSALERSAWDIVLADHRLPCYRASLALAVLQELNFDVPFVIVSGAIGEDAVVTLMRQGARDYVSKANLERLPQVVERELGAAEERRAHRKTQDELRRSRASLRNLSSRLLSVREEERASLARDVHDDLGQSLVGLKYLLVRIHTESAGVSTGIDGRLTDAIARVDSLIDYGRRLSMRLRPWVLDELGLDAAVAWQLREFSSQTGVAATLTGAEVGQLASDRAIAAFRILQEALLNIGRHARATRVEVDLEATEECVVLRVADDGRGITEEEGASARSVGLIGMRERADAFGGRVEIGPGPTGGTSVVLTMPRRG